MDDRRRFIKLASAAAIPALALSTKTLRAEDNDERGNEILGSWNVVTTLPFPPGSFREFVSFSPGGAVVETNSFLNTASNLDFSAFGLPSVVNASDGFGSWKHAGEGTYQVVFRKLLFDGSRQNFGDLLVTGTLRIDEGKLEANWRVVVVNVAGDLLVDFGPVTTQGKRLQ